MAVRWQPFLTGGLHQAGDAMLHIEPGDRIELLYDDAPATTIRATVDRLRSDREEGLGPESENYFVCWVEIIVDEPSDMDARQVLLLDTEFQCWLNGRRVSLRKSTAVG